MKKTILFMFLITALIISGCAQPVNYGNKITKSETISVKDIMTSAGSFEGKTVKLEGKIVSECPTGCWIDLKDDTGIVYVDFNPSGFAIPQKTGGMAVVQGKVISKNGKTTIIGEGVQIK